jgi:hypothetical protein
MFALLNIPFSVLGGAVIISAGAAWLYFGHQRQYMSATSYKLTIFQV